MNTSKLQAFATDARRQLMNAVQARLDAALMPNSDAQVDDPRAFDFLQREIGQAGGGVEGRRHVVERYAYRWFNRIIAFRYMDVHGFTGTPVVSSAGLTSTNGLPEVLAAAKRGEYDDDTVFSLRVNDKAKERIEGLLSGSIMADDPQGRAYGLLLQSECRFWNHNLPFMFESVGKEAGRVDELLMPADLLAEGSVLRNAVEVMTPEDCGVDDPSGNVEIIGWLYQYYISERKNEVMDGFKKNHKAGAEEIPAATQLFTPDWIVRYLVQNTVGRLWIQSHPDSQLYKNWNYYIQPSEDDSAGNEDILNIQAPEDLTVCDPACGSGHMLTYAFDLLYEIYEEEGYAPSDIPGLILKHNLYGMEIDERAASLAAFALTMKARSRSRRFFKKQVEPNIQRIAPIAFKEGEVVELNDLYQVNLDSTVWNTYAKADVYGSLIQPPQELVDLAASVEDAEDEITLFDSLLRERVEEVFTQTRYLARRLVAVVANPPYMGAKNMSGELKQFVQDHYEDGKADLMTAFMLRAICFIRRCGFWGMINLPSWLSLSSFEKLRNILLRQQYIASLLDLGRGIFGTDFGSVAFIVQGTLSKGRKGIYRRLYKGTILSEIRPVHAIEKLFSAKKLVERLIYTAQVDWDSFETSWDFQQFALLDPDQGAQAGDLLEEAVSHLREYWDRVSEEQRQREIRNNEMVADAYDVRDDVPCDVLLERVSLKRNVAFTYPKDTPEVRNEKFAQDVVKELISYAVGCMFGRYSLDKPGLILASRGETLDDYHAQIPSPSFGPDADNVIPVTETDCFEDDIVTRFRRFLSVAFGKENLAANIAYIEQVLGKSIRKYFVNDFYNDHVKMYSNRPIYWQYSSQTNNKGSFKALVYLHRYTPKTTNVVLNYLRDYANKIADIADSLERSDRTADKKQAAKLRKAILECKDYEDQTLYPLATRNLEIDLDDGVLVNYLRMGKALRSIPAIEKKRKEVSTWTWPVHPLKEEDKEVRNGKE